MIDVLTSKRDLNTAFNEILTRIMAEVIENGRAFAMKEESRYSFSTRKHTLSITVAPETAVVNAVIHSTNVSGPKLEFDSMYKFVACADPARGFLAEEPVPPRNLEEILSDLVYYELLEIPRNDDSKPLN